jgi:hypothetical protein
MGPEKRPSGLVSIDAAGAAVKSLPTPPDHFRRTNTPGTRRLKVQFDGDWLSLRSRNRTRCAETLEPDAHGAESRTHCRRSALRRFRHRGSLGRQQRCVKRNRAGCPPDFERTPRVDAAAVHHHGVGHAPAVSHARTNAPERLYMAVGDSGAG